MSSASKQNNELSTAEIIDMIMAEGILPNVILIESIDYRDDNRIILSCCDKSIFEICVKKLPQNYFKWNFWGQKY